MRTPVVVDDNARVGRRHAHSIVLSAFFRNEYLENSMRFRTVEDFYGDGNGEEAFYRYTADLPPEVITSVSTVLPTSVQEDLDIASGGWIEELQKLVRTAGESHKSEVAHFRAQLGDAVKRNNFHLAHIINKSLETVHGRRLIDFFSRVNVLPKYGFPVDTVELRVDPAAHRSATSLDLSRDLVVAVNEYAPGNSIVARGLRIESAGLRKMQKKDLIERYYSICAECETIEVSLSMLREECSCGAKRRGSPTKYVKPEFGFLASRDIKAVGLVRPVTRWN